MNTPRLTPAIQAGTLFTVYCSDHRLNPDINYLLYFTLLYPGGMEGLVDLGDLLHTELVYPSAARRPIQVLTGPGVD